MAKLTLSDLTSLIGNESAAIASINNSWLSIETAMENTLSRDGTSPNEMSADFDLNSNDLLNGGALNGTTLTVSGLATVGSLTVGGTSLDSQVSAAAASAAAALVSENAAAASASNAATSETNAATSETNAAASAAAASAAATNPSLNYTYDNTTTVGAASGEVRFDDTDLSLATRVYISDNDSGGTDQSAFIATWDNSTNSSTRGYLTFTNTDSSTSTVFTITGTSTDNGTDHTLVVTYVSGDSSYTDADNIAILFAPAGDAGGVTITGTPVADQIAVFTDTSEIEGDADLTFTTASNTFALAPVAGTSIMSVGGANILVDSPRGTLTLSNVDAIDATTEATIEAAIDTLTLSSLTMTTNITSILDEDNMVSDSAAALATQQSIKAYVDTQLTAEDLDLSGDTGTIAIDLDSETLTLAGGEGITTAAATNTVTTSLNLDALTATAPITASDFLAMIVASSGFNRKITFANFESTLNHDSLSGFVANEHIDHSSVSITAGDGLSGGGDLTTTRTLDVDLNELTTEISIAAADFIAMVDATDSGSGKITFANFESTLDHDSLSGFVLNEHIDWTSTTENFSTSGTAATGNLTVTDSIYVVEQAAANADTAGQGQFWVQNDAPNTPQFTDDTGTDFNLLHETIIISVSDETTALTTGTAKVTFHMPFAMTLTDIKATVTSAPTGQGLIADVNDGGTSIMTTDKLDIDATETSTETAATAPALTDTALAENAVITVDIDQVGSTVAGAGLKVYLIGYRA